MEELKQVRSNQIDKKCPNCGTGNMRFNGIVMMTTPQTYEHLCDNCGSKAVFGMKYPYVV